MRGRWAGDTFGLFATLTVIVLCGLVLAWVAPKMINVAVNPAAAEEEAEQGSPLMTAPVETAMAEIRELDTKSGDLNAFSALSRALCGSLPTDPLISASLVTGEGGRTQTIVMAMPPGTGTWTASEIAASFPQCMGASTIIDVPEWAPRYSAASSASNSETVVWSRGDFVMVSSGDFEDAAQVDQAAEDALIDNLCLDLYPKVEDRYHNLVVSGDDYRIPTNEREVSIKNVVPEDDEGNELSQPVESEIPDPGAEVVLPEVPAGREYWPELPEPMSIPVIDAPADEPDTSEVIDVPAYDPDGPGCGWVFFSYQEVETEAATQSQEEEMVNDVKASLREKAESWAKTVVDFWDSRDEYEEVVGEYEEYRAEVDSVREYWENVVAPQWDEYDRLVAERQAAIEVRDAWLEEFTTAEAEWDEFVDVCVDRDDYEEMVREQRERERQEQEEREGITPGPNTVSPTPTPTPEPTESPVFCDSQEMPQILNEQAPDVPDAPTRPTPPDQANEERN